MTYNVFGGTLSLTQSRSIFNSRFREKTTSYCEVLLKRFVQLTTLYTRTRKLSKITYTNIHTHNTASLVP